MHTSRYTRKGKLRVVTCAHSWKFKFYSERCCRFAEYLNSQNILDLYTMCDALNLYENKINFLKIYILFQSVDTLVNKDLLIL